MIATANGFSTKPAAQERIVPDTAGDIDRVLALGHRLVDAAAQFALQLGTDDFDVELPPIVGSDADQAHLRPVAPLYLACELERAGLVPALELLSGVFASGGLPGDLGSASPLLMRFWQERHNRFTGSERQAFFSRLFGDTSGPAMATESGTNVEFDALMTALATTLVNTQTYPLVTPGFITESPLRTAALELASNLLPRSGGIAAFAARDLLKTIQQALDILRQKQVQLQFRAASVWTAVSNIQQMKTGTAGHISEHVTRGKAGMLVLAWLAESAPALNNNQQLISPDSPLPVAAASWLDASKRLAPEEKAESGKSAPNSSFMLPHSRYA
jgi:hypothetical protein